MADGTLQYIPFPLCLRLLPRMTRNEIPEPNPQPLFVEHEIVSPSVDFHSADPGRRLGRNAWALDSRS